MEKPCYKNKKWCTHQECKKYKTCKDSFWQACIEQEKIGRLLRLDTFDLSAICDKCE